LCYPKFHYRENKSSKPGLSCTRYIQSAPSNSLFLRSILILSLRLPLGLPMFLSIYYF
jgi:hypothetical protein